MEFFIQCNFTLFNTTFFNDLMQSFCVLTRCNLCKLNPIVFYLFSVICFIYLFYLIFFINVMQSSFICLLWLNFEARREHLTIPKRVRSIYLLASTTKFDSSNRNDQTCFFHTSILISGWITVTLDYVFNRKQNHFCIGLKNYALMVRQQSSKFPTERSGLELQ